MAAPLFRPSTLSPRAARPGVHPRMMYPNCRRVVVTSVIRHAPERQKAGFLSVIDLSSGRLVRRLSVPESTRRESDVNPRGGLRGARGLDISADRLLLANTERVLMFDRAWNASGEVTHPWMGGVHDVLADKDSFWVCCTSADLLVNFSFDGRVLGDWEWRGEDSLVERFGLQGIPRIDRSLDYRLPHVPPEAISNLAHVNSLSRHPKGLVVSLGRVISRQRFHQLRRRGIVSRVARRLGLPASLGRVRNAIPALPASRLPGSRSAIVLLSGGRPEILRIGSGLPFPDHNGILDDDRLVFNDSNASRAVEMSLTDKTCRAVSVPGDPPFVRGLLRIGPRRYLAGSQAPAAIYEIDFERKSVLRQLSIEGHPNESVYAISRLTDDFDDPPPALCE